MPNRIISRRGPLVGRVGKRRETEWFPSANISGSTVLPAASFVLLQSLSAASLAKRPFTVTRTVGSVWVLGDQDAAEEFPFGALGFIVVSDKASATGVTAVPDPISEEGSDGWFTYRSFAVSSGPILGRPATEFAFDSRAQRKVQDGEDIVVMVANAHATQGFRFAVKFRLLIKVS